MGETWCLLTANVSLSTYCCGLDLCGTQTAASMSMMRHCKQTNPAMMGRPIRGVQRPLGCQGLKSGCCQLRIGSGGVSFCAEPLCLLVAASPAFCLGLCVSLDACSACSPVASMEPELWPFWAGALSYVLNIEQLPGSDESAVMTQQLCTDLMWLTGCKLSL